MIQIVFSEHCFWGVVYTESCGLLSQLLKMKRKSIVVFIFKIACYLGLIYQLTLSTKLYLEYDTVTRIEYQTIDDNPAVAICFPRLKATKIPVQYIYSQAKVIKLSRQIWNWCGLRTLQLQSIWEL